MAPHLFSFFYMNIFVYLLSLVLFHFIPAYEYQLVGLRFVQEIKIIFKYKDCLKVLRIVICKYKDLVMAWVLSFKETLLLINTISKFLAVRTFWVFMWMKILYGITNLSMFPKDIIIPVVVISNSDLPYKRT